MLKFVHVNTCTIKECELSILKIWLSWKISRKYVSRNSAEKYG